MLVAGTAAAVVPPPLETREREWYLGQIVPPFFARLSFLLSPPFLSPCAKWSVTFDRESLPVTWLTKREEGRARDWRQNFPDQL